MHGWYHLLRGPLKSREQIVAFQNKRLRWIVGNAYQRVPYYRRLFDEAGITPGDIRTLDDLPKIPLTSRYDIQFLDPRESCARGLDHGKLLVRRTSGSSGAPLNIRRRWLEERLLLARRLRSHYTSIDKLRSRRATIGYVKARNIWNSEKQSTPLYEKLGFIPRNFIDYTLPKDEIVKRLEKYRPDTIYGTPSILSWIADEWSASDRQRVVPKHMRCGAETLTPDARQKIEQAFGAPVSEGYGSHEFVCIANECPQGGVYHIYEESLIVEVLRDGQPVQPGEEGELVGTALNSFAMPFLRYRQGDLVVRGPDACSCGSPYSTLLKIQGRIIDKFILPNGNEVHPYKIAVVMRDGAPWVRRFQIIQQQRNRFRFRAVPNRQPSDTEIQEMTGRIEEKLSRAATVSIELVEELPPSESGKFYPFVSYERLQVWRASGGPAGGLLADIDGEQSASASPSSSR